MDCLPHPQAAPPPTPNPERTYLPRLSETQLMVSFVITPSLKPETPR